MIGTFLSLSMVPMMNNGFGFGIFFVALHSLAVLAGIIGIIFLLLWAQKHLSGPHLWKWGWILLVGGFIVAGLSVAAGNFGGRGGMHRWQQRGPGMMQWQKNGRRERAPMMRYEYDDEYEDEYSSEEYEDDENGAKEILPRAELRKESDLTK